MDQLKANKQPPFSATLSEKLAVPISYAIAFLYTYTLAQSDQSQTSLFFILFTLSFCLAGELIYHKHKAPLESWIWLGCIWISLLSQAAGRNHVWNDYVWLFLHAYAVYWLLARSGRLTKGQSSHFLPVDALNGLLVFPFRHFFLRMSVLTSTIIDFAKKKGSLKAKLSTFTAILIALVFFLAASSLLSSADQTFSQFVSNIVKYLRIENFYELLFRFMISLPIGAYLYGLVIGTHRESPEQLSQRGKQIEQRLETLRKVPSKVWSILLGAFSLLYLAFFIIQGSYLFGAFTRTLPENFTVAEYARQGFFELCAIMALNFGLLWVVTQSSQPAHQKTQKIMSTLLLTESILFAVTAFSKLALYISYYGFTPLRLQSTWLICVLTVGCATALYSLWTGKKTARIWILFSGVSLALLHLY